MAKEHGSANRQSTHTKARYVTYNGGATVIHSHQAYRNTDDDSGSSFTMFQPNINEVLAVPRMMLSHTLCEQGLVVLSLSQLESMYLSRTRARESLFAACCLSGCALLIVNMLPLSIYSVGRDFRRLRRLL